MSKFLKVCVFFITTYSLCLSYFCLTIKCEDKEVKLRDLQELCKLSQELFDLMKQCMVMRNFTI